MASAKKTTKGSTSKAASKAGPRDETASNAKKASKGATKKAAKGATKKPTKPKARAAKPVVALLDAKQKQKLLKPPSGWVELADKSVAAWSSHRALVRVKGSSPAKLAGLVRAATRAQEKADAAAHAAAVANDAVLAANDAAWKLVLAVYGIAQASQSTAPEVLQAFDFLADAFARGPAAPVEPDPDPPTT